MQNGSPNASSPAIPSRAPEIIFANWREMLNQLKLARDVRHTYAQAIEGYLSYCVGNGLSVGVESARGFVSDALRRGLTHPEDLATGCEEVFAVFGGMGCRPGDTAPLGATCL